jgi:uncharacterized lipoprotein YmbA
MRLFRVRRACAWLALCVAGCTSVPIHYHTLLVPEDPHVPPAAAAMGVDVRVVQIPAFLQRPEMMVLGEPGEVTLLENEQWASPLIDEIRDAVRFELRNRLTRVADSEGLRSLTTLSVVIEVERFETRPDRYALIDATWSASARRADDEANHLNFANCRFNAYERIGDGYAEIVKGYQRELAALADAIVSALAPGEGGAASCQATVNRQRR